MFTDYEPSYWEGLKKFLPNRWLGNDEFTKTKWRLSSPSMSGGSIVWARRE